jgi:hypothetical protein
VTESALEAAVHPRLCDGSEYRRSGLQDLPLGFRKLNSCVVNSKLQSSRLCLVHNFSHYDVDYTSVVSLVSIMKGDCLMTYRLERVGLWLRGDGILAQLIQLAICLIVYRFFVRFYLPFPSTVEDSFILFRYASHLANHHGLSWNGGIPRPQGMTGLAWATLIGLTQRVCRGDIVFTAGLVGMFLGFLTIILLYYSLRRSLPQSLRFLAFVGCASFSFSPLAQRHATSGMETILVFLDFSIVVFLMTVLPRDRPSYVSTVAVLYSSLTFLIRPDATLFCVAVFAIVIYTETSSRKILWVIMTVFGAVLLIAIECFAIGRYFTTALPLPVYLKISANQLRRNPEFVARLVPWVLSYQLEFLSTVAIWLACTMLFVVARPNSISSRLRAILVGSFVFYLYLFTVVPIMNFNMRYQAPLLVPILFVGVVAVGGMFERSQNIANHVAVIYLCLILILFSLGSISKYKSEMRADLSDHDAYGILGKRLAAIPKISVASTEAGMLAYYSDQRFLDLVGLNDSFVAINHDQSDYSAKLNEYLLTDYGYPDIYVRSPNRDAKYSDLCTFPKIIVNYDYFGSFDKGIQLFIRHNSIHGDQLREMVRQLPAFSNPNPNVGPCQN